jgi:YesN/AraC family two-component response regulator
MVKRFSLYGYDVESPNPEIIISTMRRISKSDAGKLYNDYCRYIIDCVEENYMKPITLTQISSELNYSLPYTSKNLRMIWACHLMNIYRKKE